MRTPLLGWFCGVALIGCAVLAAFAYLGRSSGQAVMPVRPPGPARETGLAGTAFAVAPGVLVTNTHVTQGCRRQGRAIQVSGLGGAWQVLAEDPETDLALLGFSTGTALSGPAPGDTVLPVSSARLLPRGAPVMTLGYPIEGASGRLHSATGQVLRAALTIHDPAAGRGASFVAQNQRGQEVVATWDDGLRYFGEQQADRLHWMLEIDAVVSEGNSGGPVLDGAGNVVGVVYAGDRQRRLTAVVPLDDLRGLLRRADIVPRFGVRSLVANPDWSAVRTGAAPAVHRVFC